MNARQDMLCRGAFNKPGKDDNPHTGQTVTKNLKSRLKDFELMAARPGNDARGPHNGFNKPGSLKK